MFLIIFLTYKKRTIKNLEKHAFIIIDYGYFFIILKTIVLLVVYFHSQWHIDWGGEYKMRKLQAMIHVVSFK